MLLIGLLLVTFTAQIYASITSVTFINSFEQVQFQFGEKVTASLCLLSRYIPKDELEKINLNKAQCFFSSTTSLNILPTVDSKLRRGDIIHFYDNKTLPLLSETDEPTPVVEITGPSTFCLCPKENVLFDIDLSTGLGYGLLLDITWTIHSTPIEDEVSDPNLNPSTVSTSAAATPTAQQQSAFVTTQSTPGAMQVLPTSSIVTTTTPAVTTQSTLAPAEENIDEDLQKELDEQAGATEISLGADNFRTDRKYHISVSAKNVFNKVSNPATIDFSFADNCGPRVDVIQGSTLTVDDAVIYHAIVDYPVCYNMTDAPVFQWSLKADNVAVDVSPFITNTNIFVAEANTLALHKLYNLSVSVTTTNVNDVTSKAVNFQEFELHDHHLEVGILGGVRSVAINDILKIETFPREGVDDGTYTWKCLDDNKNACKNGGLVLPNTKDVNLKILAEDGFIVHKIYTFKLKFEDEGEVMEETTLVNITPAFLPQLVVKVMQHELTDAQEDIIFIATISGKLQKFSYTWGCYNEYDIRKKDFRKRNDVEGPRDIEIVNPDKNYQIRTFRLHVNANSFFPGFHLTCECRVVHNGKNIFASDDIVNFVPLQNTAISVFPTIGLPSETDFRLRVYNWVGYASNQPLLFRFGFIEGSKMVYLTGWSTKNSISGVRLPGKSQYPVEVFVEVQNNEHAKTTVKSSVEMGEAKLSKPELENQLLEKIRAYTRRDQFLASVYLENYIITNGLKNLPLGNVSSDAIQMEMMRYIDLFMNSPLTPATIENVLHVTAYFFNMSEGRVYEGVVNKTMELIYYLTDENKIDYDMEYITEDKVASITSILTFILNQPSYRYKLQHVLSGILKKLSRSACSVLENPSVANHLFVKGDIQFPLLQLTIKNERFLTSASSTVISLDKDFADAYATWPCSGPSSQCNGVCISEVKYDREMYEMSFANFSKEWILVTDVYHVRLWNPIPPYQEINTTHTNETYKIILPTKNLDVSIYENIQCQVLDPETGSYDNMTCDSAKYVEKDFPNGEIHCKCQKLGKIAAFQEIIQFITTTELPHKGDNITFDMHFYAPKSICIFPNKYKFFKKKLLAGLVETFKIEEERIILSPCRIGSIIVNVFILDGELGTRRNYNLLPEVLDFIHKQDFRVEMSSGIYPMFDVRQTTPKPDPPTIPPIGRVDTDWYPIGIAIGVVLFFFFLCAVTTWLIHTRLLKNKVFNEVNSNLPGELTNGEKLEMASAKVRERKMNDILSEDTNEAANKANKTTTASTKKRNGIQPVADTDSVAYSASSYRGSAQLDEPRLALDDSSDEDEAANGIGNEAANGNTAVLFTASHASLQNRDGSKNDHRTNVDIETEGISV